ncbi:hypothetical protein [Saccharopolyspora pogona]|uniref:hypothetical protein n=1 Tax=Saccharopolyspora pogona TaxID=333966 RepID=UPI001686ADBC|nr:hypothetical protein [Saccharopolyspora pogona]
MSFMAALALMACCVVGSAVVSGLAFAVNEWAERRRRRRQIAEQAEEIDAEDWQEAAQRELFRG